MATRVLLRERPHRALALVTPTHALILRHIPSSTAQASTTPGTPGQNAPASPRCLVELVDANKADLSDYRPVSRHNVVGTLGLITVENDVFLCVVSGASRVAVVRPGENVQRILNADFYCLTSSEFDQLLHDTINMYPTDTLDEDGYEQGQAQGRRDPALEHPCLALKKLLSGGSFYFSADFDLTSRLQDRSSDSAKFDFETFDQAYLWNSYMIQPLVDFRSRLSEHEKHVLDSTRLLTFAIRGFASTMAVAVPVSATSTFRPGTTSNMTILSRLSCKRAGTRFNARGIDDDGNVANFVETETVLWNPDGVTFSYVQVRGSIPLFWEQAAGLLPGQQKITITRSPQASQPAFDKHFEDLDLKYGAIHVVNLLSKEKPQEAELATKYHEHIKRAAINNRSSAGARSERTFLTDTWYDFHAETRAIGYEAAKTILKHIQDFVDGFAYCLAGTVVDEGVPADQNQESSSRRSMIMLQQEGVMRTNCLDCLDRTNLIQTIISQAALSLFLDNRQERTSSDFFSRHGMMWADNGDALSKIYAGTGALKSSYTRSGKSSIAGALADVRKSATRLYINNFADKGRQTTIDMLLGRLIGQPAVYLYDPINDYVNNELTRRAAEYSSTKEISIWVGTFNLNGRTNGINSDLAPWLCPPVDASEQNPAIVAVGFQEIVELSPQQIMSTEPGRREGWEKAVKRTLNANAKEAGSEDYVLLRGGQLVGASLSVFVKKSLLARIKNVEGSLKKTGLSGIAGNKGAVAIRMDIDNTSLCFVTAHLAAGFANYEERNRDFKTINHGLRFQRGRSIEAHDTVIWLGDFNYRIGLNYERAVRLAKSGDYETLYENDQLNLQMVAGLTFPYYSEARILFPPTYKYDLETDEYDTSEKARIPAWCDRVLRRGNNLRQISYNTAPLRFSDHRPVYATFSCEVSIVDEKIKNALSDQIYTKRKASVAGATANTKNDDSDEEDLLGYESIEPGLPPASSDRRRWWLDNGMPARSKLQAPSNGMQPNPNRPSNPWTTSKEPDWISGSAVASTSPRSIKAPPLLPSRDTSARKVPPHFDGASLPPVPKLDKGKGPVRNMSQSSVQSTTSSNGTSSITRKAPPVIPRKPPSLSSTTSGTGLSPTISRGETNGHIVTPASTSQPPIWRVPVGGSNFSPSSSSRSMVSNGATPMTPLRSTAPNASMSASKAPVRSAASLLDDTPPKLPARPKAGLMDDDDDAPMVGGWTPLVPR
jgi:endonuclease/exonuclease/phosphatase family metal-dependent hydrolase